MTNWNCDDGYGNNIAQGLTEEAAAKRAQEHADATGNACLVYADDDEGTEGDGYIVTPST